MDKSNITYVTLKVRPQTAVMLNQVRKATGKTLLLILDEMAREAVSRLDRGEHDSVTYIPYQE